MIFVIPIEGNGELGRIIRAFGIITLSPEIVSYNETWSQSSSYPLINATVDAYLAIG